MTPSDKLRIINDAFGLDVASYAKIYGVDRETYYSWRKGLEPEDEKHCGRINQLHSVARYVAQFNKYCYGRLAKTYKYKGGTLIQLLLLGKLDEDLIVEHCQSITQMLNKRENSSKSSAHGGVYVHHTSVVSNT